MCVKLRKETAEDQYLSQHSWTAGYQPLGMDSQEVFPSQKFCGKTCLEKQRRITQPLICEGEFSTYVIPTGTTQNDSLPFLIYICVKENRFWPYFIVPFFFLKSVIPLFILWGRDEKSPFCVVPSPPTPYNLQVKLSDFISSKNKINPKKITTTKNSSSILL